MTINRNSNRGFSEMESFDHSKLKNDASVEYYKSGKLAKEVLLKNGKPEGIWKEYYESGQFKLEIIFKNGKSEGVSKCYHENGQLEYEGIYKDGKKEGIWRIYFENGKLDREIIFEADYELISGRKYLKCAGCDQQIEAPRDFCVECLKKIDKLKDMGYDHFKAGVDLCAAGNFLNAIIEFSVAIEIFPEMDEPFLERGKISLRNHNYDEAIVDFNEAIRLKSFSSLRGYYYRALVYMKSGKEYGIVDLPLTTSKGNSRITIPKVKLMAVKEFSEAIQRDFDNPEDSIYLAESYQTRAGLYCLLGTWDQAYTYGAIADYKKIILLYPEKEVECKKMLAMLKNRLDSWNDLEKEEARLRAGELIQQLWAQNEEASFSYEFFCSIYKH